MPTQCNAEQFEFSCVERRRVVAAFDGGTVSSDAGALLLKRTDEAIGLIDRLAGCFIDERKAKWIEHAVRTLIGQRVFGIALGYEDLNDHEQLRHDPVLGVLVGKLEAKRRSECAALAGKSTLNRLELHPREGDGVSRYHKIRPVPEAIERVFVDLFVEAHREPPQEVVLDLDATDDPLHGRKHSDNHVQTGERSPAETRSIYRMRLTPYLFCRKRRDRAQRLGRSFMRRRTAARMAARCSILVTRS